ncbi:glucuronyl hydrolase [Fulvivirga sp. M361]|uniref:glycoside hydrolase family 88 protein n=1 Tax=Fulvivirga sp. M361 TaxID=2594266 RepID=UPI00117A62F4|nr:glycoside hydrolase family 88 protein [Fulvivirga sp. M361]TRX60194.1 glucuronyl hydrolase [Fulvivirga sp. M361]
MLRITLLFIGVQLVISCRDSKPTVLQEKGNESVSIETFFNPDIRYRMDFLLNYPVDSTGFPRSMESDGKTRGVASGDWTSGFFPGSLLYLYHLTEDERWLKRAEQWLGYLEKEKYNDRTHDMGFKINCSFGNALKTAQKEAYKKIIIQSAQTLTTRFNARVGCIKSWDFGKDKWQFPVIIDNMMNLELLFEATRLSGDSSFYHTAVAHANKTLENHYRSDNSSYHVIDYNTQTGEVVQRLTHQGYDSESVWSRGQAWGLYGFTMAYRYTSNTVFLDQAGKIAAFIMEHPDMPSDNIVYWDMKDPAIPNAVRDASASAIIASALIELGQYTGDKQHHKWANAILTTLSTSKYVLPKATEAPFLLDHSTGNMPRNDEIDLPISYADYYFLEAITRKKKEQI